MWNFSYLRNAEHLRFENELRHLFEVNSFDHKDNTTHINPVAQLIGDEGRYGFNPRFSEFWSNVVRVVKGVDLEELMLFIFNS